MSVATYWGMIGLAVGATTFLLFMWIAARTERDAKTPEELQAVTGVKILAIANLILIPSLMYWFGGQAAQ